jgi:hypothetical protein
MTWRTCGKSVALGLALAAPCWAAPPQINGTSPLGVQRGVATAVTVSGGSLSGNPRLIAPFAFTIDPRPATKSDDGNWRLNLVVDPSVAVGVYPIRVQTDDGLSNAFLFSVGQLTQIAEKEENSAFEAAQPVTAPCVVEGQSAGNDVDFFRFAGRKGQRIVLDAQCARIGSGVDPTLRLTTASHKYVASADDSPGLLTDARLMAVLPEDGEYVVELSDSRYQGGGRPVYRLVIGEVPMAEEIFPIGGRQGETVGLELRGGTLTDVGLAAATVKAAPGSALYQVRATNPMLGVASPSDPVLDLESLLPVAVSRLAELREETDPSAPPTRATAPVVFNGRIDPAGDDDRFVVAVTPGQRLHIAVGASAYGSALDGVLQVLGKNDSVLATADDTTVRPPGKPQPNVLPLVFPDPTLDFTVPSGLTEVTLKLRDLEGRGGVGYAYRMTVTPLSPTFELAPNDAQVSVPKGGTAAVAVTAVRKGYNGPITLSVADAPPGLSFREGTIAEGQTVGAFTVSTAPDATFGVVHLRVQGKGQSGSGPFVVEAEKAIVFSKQGTLPTNSMTQHGLAAALALARPLSLDAPSTPIEVPHGFGATIPVKVTRSKDADTALAITPLPLPPGVTIPASNVAAKAGEANVTVNAAVETPLGLVSVALVAKGKIGKAEQTLAVPAVTLNVVRPAALQLAAPGIEVKAGTTFELKGTIVRKGAFKEPVTVRVNGLPAGLKAEPVTVAPKATDFVVKVVADPKAAASSANANVALAFQVNKKDYPTPTTPLAVKVVATK